jgi:hypothetical protein
MLKREEIYAERVLRPIWTTLLDLTVKAESGRGLEIHIMSTVFNLLDTNRDSLRVNLVL